MKKISVFLIFMGLLAFGFTSNAECPIHYFPDGSAVGYCEDYTVIYSGSTAMGGCAGAIDDCVQILLPA